MKKRKTGTIVFLIVIIAWGICGCHHAPTADNLEKELEKEFRLEKFAAAPVSCALPDNRIKWVQSKTFSTQEGRKQSFEADLSLNVTDKTQIAVQKTRIITEQFSGYTVYSDMEQIQVKIPSSNAELFVSEIEKLGVVTHKKISSKDVTVEYTDFELRCKNLRALRDRLADLLKKTVKVEEILKVEAELSRVTCDLERYQCNLNLLKNSVAMVSLNISFNTVTGSSNTPSPVAWIRPLGNEIFNENLSVISENTSNKFALDYDCPEGFATIFSSEKEISAVNGDNAILKMRICDNLPGANAVFYRKLISRQLEQNGCAKISAKDIDWQKKSGVSISSVRGEYNYNVVIIFYQESCFFNKQNKVLVIEFLEKNTSKNKFNPLDILEKLKF